jgi:phosphoribosyl-ATP pyrophosphohydrolase/phosphoribosyl-AMP cyclohydrolase
MIVPSIDLMDGVTVQLRRGKTKVLEAGDPRPIATKFGRLGEIAVVDLDAALRQGSNAALMRDLLQLAPCRVGGGIRDVQTAIDWLDAGATKVVIGTAATPEVLSQLPRERVVAALDAVEGQVVVDGWREPTGRTVFERMHELEPLVGGFLVTIVEHEGSMQGIDLELVRKLVEASGSARLTVAGGVTTAQDVALIDQLGAEAQVGMAIYTGRMELADCLIETLRLRTEADLWPTVVVDELGVALGMVYSNAESIKAALESGKGVYHSRRRGLWRKGESSGDSQDLLRIELDCDRDALRFTVRQHGSGFCHNGTRTCWGEDRGLPHLMRCLQQRLADAPIGSYTRRLFDDPHLLKSKMLEEAGELNAASSRDEVTAEAADVLYFAMVHMAKNGISLDAVADVLDRRSLKVTRRPGNAKV